MSEVPPTPVHKRNESPSASSAHPAPRCQRFLLIGSERSGTTLLRLMLDHHPQIYCMFESEFLVDHYARCVRAQPKVYEKLIAADRVFQLSGLKFPHKASTYHQVVQDFFAQKHSETNKPIGGATIHRNVAHLPDLFPDVKYIHLLRDGRPVAASIVQMGWAGNLYVAAGMWRKTIEEIHLLQRVIPESDWFEIRYEDLLADAPGKLTEICSFLGVLYSTRMLDYPNDSTYDAPDPANAGRWRQKLSPREIYLAEMAAGSTLEGIGYRRLFRSAKPTQVERLTLFLDNRIRRTRFRCERFGVYLLLARKLWKLVGVRRQALEARYDEITRAYIR